jgi:serine/threonine protein kinase
VQEVCEKAADETDMSVDVKRFDSISGKPADGSWHESFPGGRDDVHCVTIEECVLFPEMVQSADSADRQTLITEMSGMEEVRELGSSRNGVVYLVRRRNELRDDGDEFEYFAAKFYDAGDNRDGLEAFKERMNTFLSLSHPHVIRIVGIIAPTRATGPIILTPYNSDGSLEDVLTLIRQNHTPSYWNDATKLRVILSLVSGLNYLHNHGIVHRDLKPTDLLVGRDGSLFITDYMTSFLEEHHYTRSSQVGGASYMAPEVYDGDPGTDARTVVLSFGLIIYELLTYQKVFPPSMSTTVMVRRAKSSSPRDRPTIPRDTHAVLRELITRSWNPTRE